MVKGIDRPDYDWSGGAVVQIALPSGVDTYTQSMAMSHLTGFTGDRNFINQCAMRYPLVGLVFSNLTSDYQVVLHLSGGSARYPIPPGGVFTTPGTLGVNLFRVTINRVDSAAFGSNEVFPLDIFVNDLVG